MAKEEACSFGGRGQKTPSDAPAGSSAVLTRNCTVGVVWHRAGGTLRRAGGDRGAMAVQTSCG